MDDLTVLWVSLATAEGIGAARLKAFTAAHGGIAALADAIEAGSLDRDGEVDPRHLHPDPLPTLRRAVTSPALRRARDAARGWCAGGTTLLHPERSDYPPLLGAIHDPPPLLFGRGRLPPAATAPAGTARTIALVGTRRATPWGERFASRLARDLAAAGVVVVSGLALGIDGAAHRGALEADGGLTLAVLGSGLDRVHPPAHQGLADRIVDRGAVLSEHPPDTNGRPGHFPRRNRIIAGLAHAVVVVEAPVASGARITVSAALDEGRSVHAVPQRPDSALGRGAVDLLREGADPVASATDLLTRLGWDAPSGREPGTLPPLHRELLEALARAGDGRVPAAGGVGSGAVLAALTELELAGLVRRDDRGGWRAS